MHTYAKARRVQDVPLLPSRTLTSPLMSPFRASSTSVFRRSVLALCTSSDLATPKLSKSSDPRRMLISLKTNVCWDAGCGGGVL